MALIVDAHGRDLAGDERAYSLDEIAKLWKTGADSRSRTAVSEATAMNKQAWVYSCVTAIARTIASVRYEVFQGEDRRAKKGDPVHDLFRRPAPGKTGYDLWYTTSACCELTGNALWHMQGLRGRNKIPTALVPLNPRRVEVVATKDGDEIAGYRYKTKNQQSKTFVREEIIHFMFANPFDPLWGLAPLTAAMLAVRTDLKAAHYNEIFFDNGAQPGGILINKRSMGTRQRKQVKEEFEGDHGGIGQAHKTAVLSGDWDYQQLGLGQREMEFLQQRKFAREQIGAVFGVPGVLTNDPNRSNYSTANVELRIFAETNWLPKTHYYEDVLRSQLYARNDLDYEGRFNVDEAPGLREDIGEKIDRAVKLVRIGGTFNDAIEALGLPVKKHDWGDEWWINQAQIPARFQMERLDPEVIKGIKPVEDPPNIQSETGKDVPSDPSDRSIRNLTDPMRRVYWNSVKKYFSEPEREIRKLLKAHISDFIATGEIDQRGFSDVTAVASADLVLSAVKSITNEVGISVDTKQICLGVCAAMEEEVASIVEVQRNRLLQTPSDQHARLANRDRAIARTLTMSIFNAARIAAMIACGVERHSWFVGRDSTDVEHIGDHCIDGEVASIGEQFSIGVRYPNANDYDSPCRCITVPLVD